MNFNAKDAKECAKEREGRSCSANFARTFATYAVKFIDSLRLKLVFGGSVASGIIYSS